MTQPQGPQQGQWGPQGPQQQQQGGQWGPPPNQGYGPPQGQWGPPPPKKKHTVRNILLGLVGLIVLIVIISSVASSGSKKTPAAQPSAGKKTNSSSLSHPEDVAISSCTVDELGFADAKIVVTNHSSKPSTYAVTVIYESKTGNQQVGTGTAFVDQLQPGQASTPQDANSAQAAKAGTFTCRVGDATRTAS